MNSAPILDLRPAPWTDRPPFTVQDPGVATAGGYRVEVERRMVLGHTGAAARFTTPDGRVLDVCFRPDTNRRSLAATLEHLTCPAVAKMFGKVPPQAEPDIAARLALTIEAGFVALAAGVSADRALGRMRRRSLNLSRDEALAYRAVMPTWVPAVDIARFRDAGIPPEHAADFYCYLSPHTGEFERRYLKDVEYAACGVYARHGWSGTDYHEFRAIWHQHKKTPGGMATVPSTRWAALPPRVAALGLEAGMRAAEVRRLVASGRWDDDAVAMLIALAPAGRR